jgi:hypothetical protein
VEKMYFLALVFAKRDENYAKGNRKGPSMEDYIG